MSCSFLTQQHKEIELDLLIYSPPYYLYNHDMYQKSHHTVLVLALYPFKIKALCRPQEHNRLTFQPQDLN